MPTHIEELQGTPELQRGLELLQLANEQCIPVLEQLGHRVGLAHVKLMVALAGMQLGNRSAEKDGLQLS